MSEMICEECEPCEECEELLARIASLEDKIATEVSKCEFYRTQHEGLQKCYRMACDLNMVYDKMIYEMSGDDSTDHEITALTTRGDEMSEMICEECGDAGAARSCLDPLPICEDCYRLLHDRGVSCEVVMERRRQREKGYDEAHDDEQGAGGWAADMAQRGGLLATAIGAHDPISTRRIAIQMAAMCIALAQHLDRDGAK